MTARTDGDAVLTPQSVRVSVSGSVDSGLITATSLIVTRVVRSRNEQGEGLGRSCNEMIRKQTLIQGQDKKTTEMTRNDNKMTREKAGQKRAKSGENDDLRILSSSAQWWTAARL